MGAIVSLLAFPVPDRTYSEAALKHQGPDKLVWITLQQSRAHLKVPGLYLRVTNPKFTILYSHGNAEDVGINIPYLEQLSKALQVDVLAYEYPGYSIAEGEEPSETLCYFAIQAAFDYLTTTRRVDPTTIVLLGRSLGTGPTVDLASKTPHIAGTILQSPLESGIRCVLGTCGSLILYPMDIFLSYAKVEEIAGPVFILHGLEDRVVPCQNGKALQALLEQRPQHFQKDAGIAYPPKWIPVRGHNDMPADHCMLMFQHFLQFLPKYQQYLRKQMIQDMKKKAKTTTKGGASSSVASSEQDNKTTLSEQERRALAEERKRQEQLKKEKAERVFKPPMGSGRSVTSSHSNNSNNRSHGQTNQKTASAVTTATTATTTTTTTMTGRSNSPSSVIEDDLESVQGFKTTPTTTTTTTEPALSSISEMPARLEV